MRRLACLIWCCALTLTAVSCGCDRPGTIVNSRSLTLELEDYVVMQELANYPVMVDKVTLQAETFFFDPITELGTPPEFLRYTKVGKNTVSATDGRGVYDVYTVDLNTFYWDNDLGLYNGAYSSYLGAEDLFPELKNGLTAQQQMGLLCGFFSCPGGYLAVRTTGLFILGGGRKSKERCLLEEQISQQNAAFDGNTVYYIAEDRTLVSFHIPTSTRQELRRGVSDFRLTDEGLFILQGRQLLLFRDGEDLCLAHNAGNVLGGVTGYVYYCDGKGTATDAGALHRVRIDGTGDEILPVEGYFWTLGVVNDPPLLMYYGLDGEIHTCEYDGKS